MERRECPFCVSRYCTNCFFKDVGVNRRWLALHLPDGECRRCGAHRNAVREKPVRHISATVRQDHLDGYAQILLTKAPRLVPQDPQRMHAIDVLLAAVDRDFFSAYSAHSRLESGVYGWDAINVQNELNTAKLRIEEAIRQWVADHPVADQFDDLESLREDAAKLRALEAAGVDGWEGYDHAMEILRESEDDRG